MASAEELRLQVLLAEYAQLKAEQNARVGFRDNLLYATLASYAAVMAAAISLAERGPFVLLLPAASVVLGWTYLVNDEKISAMGRHIRVSLAPEIEQLIGTSTSLLRWEHAHRQDSRRRSRKVIQLAIDLATFCLAAAIAIVFYALSGPYTTMLIVLAVIELVMVGVLLSQIVRYADLSV